MPRPLPKLAWPGKGMEAASPPTSARPESELSSPSSTPKPHQLEPSEKENPPLPTGPAIPKPPSGFVLENLTVGAAAQRLRRIFQPRKDGSFLVPQDFVDMYKDVSGGGRKKIEILFEKMSYNVDTICGYIVNLYKNPQSPQILQNTWGLGWRG